MELRMYLDILRRWAWLIIIGCIVAGLSAFYISNNQEPVYRATAQLLVVEGNSTVDKEYNSLLMSERLASSYVERLLSHDVLAEAVENLNLNLDPNHLTENIKVQVVGNTQLISISVDHTNPQVAQDLANEIPTVFEKKNEGQQLSRFSSIKLSIEEQLDQLNKEIATAEFELQKDLNQLGAEIATEELAQLKNEILVAELKQLQDKIAAAELAQVRGEYVAAELALLKGELAAAESELQAGSLPITPNNEVTISRQNENVQRMRETFYQLQYDLEEIRLIEVSFVFRV